MLRNLFFGLFLLRAAEAETNSAVSKRSLDVCKSKPYNNFILTLYLPAFCLIFNY